MRLELVGCLFFLWGEGGFGGGERRAGQGIGGGGFWNESIGLKVVVRGVAARCAFFGGKGGDGMCVCVVD